MPIDLYSSIKKASQWAFGSPLLNGVLGSSLFVAPVIALLMVLIVMVMYPAKTGTPFSIVIKMFIYMLFGSLLIIFLHDGVIKYMMEEEYSSKDSDELMRNLTIQGRTADPSYERNYNLIKPQLAVQEPAPIQFAPLTNVNSNISSTNANMNSTNMNSTNNTSSTNNNMLSSTTPPVFPTQQLATDTIKGGGTLNAMKARKYAGSPYS